MTQLSFGTRELLARAKIVDGPAPGAQARIYRALTGTAVASTVALGVKAAEASLATGATSSKLLTLITTGKIGLLASVSVGLLGGTLVLAGVEHFVPSRPTLKSPASVRVAPSRVPPSTAHSVVAEAATATATAPVTSLELPIAASAIEKATPAPSPSIRSPIAEETRSLAQVQQALRQGDGQRALSLLGRYRRDFVKGALGEEAAAAEVFAYCAAGDIAAAAKARTRFRQQFAGSPLEPRVEASCANSVVLDAKDR